MRKRNLIIVMAIAIFAITACKTAKERTSEKITVLEKEIMSSKTKIDSVKAQKLIDLYVNFADNFKTDTITPVYLLKAADISMNILKHQQSIQLLDRIMKDYTGFSKVPDCLFLKAFIYENQAKDFEKAKAFYTEFLNKYPNHELAPSAKAAIDNMGIPMDILIKSFEQKNKESKETSKQKS
ncbi:MAG: tetratricopeptide repeat protein [Bacteroidetes bacterium]|nr:tetratricopeptide repeat protein [Bacteroidota bacterium]